MRLHSAGLARRVSPVAFLATKLFAAVIGLVLGIMFFSPSKGPVMGFALGMGLAAVGFIGPDFILNKKIRARQERLSQDLPDALDLLAVSVEAGLGFDAAVVKITEQVEGPLGEEFALTLNEMRIGESRQEALEEAVRTHRDPRDRRLRTRDHPGRPVRNLAGPNPPRPGGRHASPAADRG